MNDNIVISLLIVLLIAFLFFGYKDDFQRDKKGFIHLVLSVIISFIGFVVLTKVHIALAFAFLFLSKFISDKLKPV